MRTLSTWDDEKDCREHLQSFAPLLPAHRADPHQHSCYSPVAQTTGIMEVLIFLGQPIIAVGLGLRAVPSSRWAGCLTDIQP